MISGSNEQLQQELEYNLLKPDCHSYWISKLPSGREDTFEERFIVLTDMFKNYSFLIWPILKEKKNS